MKYLSDYLEEKQTKLFNEYGAFWAFGNAQFEERRKPGMKYVSLGAGLIAQKDNYKEFIDKLDELVETAREEDLSENGREGVIERELANLECFWTGSIEDAVDRLKPYGISEEEIKAVFYQKVGNYEPW